MKPASHFSSIQLGAGGEQDPGKLGSMPITSHENVNVLIRSAYIVYTWVYIVPVSIANIMIVRAVDMRL